MIQITEKDDRLLLQFWDNDYKTGPDGTVSMSVAQTLVKEIDISAHIERATKRAVHGMIPVETFPPANGLPQMTVDGFVKWAPNWLSIDLAPKNGAWIWGYVGDMADCATSEPVRWLDESPYKHHGVTVREAGWYGDAHDRDRPCTPTHWLPMPQPPRT